MTAAPPMGGRRRPRRIARGGRARPTPHARAAARTAVHSGAPGPRPGGRRGTGRLPPAPARATAAGAVARGPRRARFTPRKRMTHALGEILRSRAASDKVPGGCLSAPAARPGHRPARRCSFRRDPLDAAPRLSSLSLRPVHDALAQERHRKKPFPRRRAQMALDLRRQRLLRASFPVTNHAAHELRRLPCGPSTRCPPRHRNPSLSSHAACPHSSSTSLGPSGHGLFCPRG